MNPIIEKYMALNSEVEALEKSEIVQRYLSLKNELETSEAEVKTLAKENKEDVAAGNVRFQYVERYRKWFDYEAAVSAVGKKLKPVIDEITVITKEIDTDKFTDLVRSGVIPEEARVQAYREEQISAQVRKTKVEKPEEK